MGERRATARRWPLSLLDAPGRSLLLRLHCCRFDPHPATETATAGSGASSASSRSRRRSTTSTWTAAATGIASNAPSGPSKAPPIRIARMTASGVKPTAFFMTHGTRTEPSSCCNKKTTIATAAAFCYESVNATMKARPPPSHGPKVDEEHLFLKKFEKPIGIRSIRNLVRKYLTEANIPGASTHALRWGMNRSPRRACTSV
jgi:hypothetical protein